MRIKLDQKTVRLGPYSTKKGNFKGLMLPCVVFLEQPVQFKRKRIPLPRCLLYFCDSSLSIMLLLQHSFTTKGNKVSGVLLVC